MTKNIFKTLMLVSTLSAVFGTTSQGIDVQKEIARLDNQRAKNAQSQIRGNRMADNLKPFGINFGLTAANLIALGNLQYPTALDDPLTGKPLTFVIDNRHLATNLQNLRVTAQDWSNLTDLNSNVGLCLQFINEMAIPFTPAEQQIAERVYMLALVMDAWNATKGDDRAQKLVTALGSLESYPLNQDAVYGNVINELKRLIAVERKRINRHNEDLLTKPKTIQDQKVSDRMAITHADPIQVRSQPNRGQDDEISGIGGHVQGHRAYDSRTIQAQNEVLWN